MRKAIAFGCVMVFALGMTGCGGGGGVDGAIKNRIKAMNDLADATKANDDAKKKEAEKRIDDADAQLNKASKDDIIKAVKSNEEAWKTAGQNLAKSGNMKYLMPEWATKAALSQ